MRQNRIRSLWIVVIAAGLLGGCSPSEKRPPETHPLVAGVQTEVVHLEAAHLVYQAVGTVRAATTAVLAAQLAGTVREIRVKEGDHVRRGQLLAVLDDRGAQAQVEGADAGVNEALQGEAEVDQALKAATADRQFAELTFNRYKSLLAKNSLSRQEYDAAEARYQAALANAPSRPSGSTSSHGSSRRVPSRIRRKPISATRVFWHPLMASWRRSPWMWEPL
jgi:multidrug efflux pump subunit AcrA (membrane-fusion protein)